MRKIFLFLLAGFIISCNSANDASEPLVKETATDATATPPPVEFADQKYVDMGKQYMQHMQSGNVEEWGNYFADNAVYAWSAGDSLSGKAAIVDYWKKRRSELIETLSFANDIWLPVKVNQPQRGPDMAGVWLMNWNQVTVTYKNGKTLTFWVHNDFHFDANDKIDRAVQYIDRAPINEALRK